jgi:predicted phosphodiesterase
LVRVLPLVSAPEKAMASKILHLSDLHFGFGFNWDRWNDIVAMIPQLQPDLIIITGDVVNTPWRWSIKTAASQIESLRKQLAGLTPPSAGSDTAKVGERVIFVPGNHDTRIVGLIDVKWLIWFFIIAALLAMATVDWRNDVLHQQGTTYTLAAGAAMLLLLRLLTTTDLSSSFGETMLTSIQKYDWANIGIVPVDSASALTLGAQGKVPNTLRHKLREQFGEGGDQDGVWFAAVHHHPLPIPYDSKNESAMIMKNAGTLLKELANFNIPIVLHGHKHNPYFSRVVIRNNRGIEKQISVLSAGTATEKALPHPLPHSFNVIRICERSSVSVDVYTSINGQGFQLEQTKTIDIIDAATQQAQEFERLARALPLRVRSMIGLASIDEHGNCRLVREFSGVSNTQDCTVTEFPYQFPVKLEAGLVTDTFGYSQGITYRPIGAQGSDSACCVTFNEALRQGDTIDFDIGYYAMNFCAMDKWQYRNMYKRRDYIEAIVFRIPDSFSASEFYMQVRFPDGTKLPKKVSVEIKLEGGDWHVCRNVAINKISAVPLVFARISPPLHDARYRITWTVDNEGCKNGDKNVKFQRALLGLSKHPSHDIRQQLDSLFSKFIYLACDDLIHPADWQVNRNLSEIVSCCLFVFNDDDKLLHLVASGGTGQGAAAESYPFGIHLPGMAFKSRQVIFYDKNLPQGKTIDGQQCEASFESNPRDVIDEENESQEVIVFPLYVADERQRSNGTYTFDSAPFAVLRLAVDGNCANIAFRDTGAYGAHATFCATASFLLSKFVRDVILIPGR